MSSKSKYSLLQKALKLLGLSDERAAEIISRIQDWLTEDEVGKKEEVQFPYRQRDFLSPAELNFYRVLRASVNDWAIVCPKVNLGDLFYAQTGDPRQNRAYRNRIARKHVDFLLCDPQTIKPLLGVELDDKSHQRADRRQRDKFVNAVFAAAELPIYHVLVRRSYDAKALALELRHRADITSPKEEVLTPAVESAIDFSIAVPECPKCGADMILRTARSGTNIGNQFWGCARYPKCRSILPFVG